MSVIYCDLWSGKLKNFYVWMICDEVGVVCHGRIDGCNLCCELLWCGCDYPDVLTVSGLCMNHDDSSCNVCENEIVIWNDFAYPCLHGGALNLTWNGTFCEV